jgi:site-specific recombinase XerD
MCKCVLAISSTAIAPIWFVTLLTQNVNPKKVQELLGHANIAETMHTYSHVF